MNLDELKPSDPVVMLDGINKMLAVNLKRHLDVSTIEDLHYSTTRDLLSVPRIAGNKEFKLKNQASYVVRSGENMLDGGGFDRTTPIGGNADE